jgi:hypothetical protein
MKTNRTKKMYALVLVSLLISIFASALAFSPVAAAGLENANLYGGNGGSGQGRGIGSGTGTGTGTQNAPLTNAEKDALQKAILEEYKAYNLYASVLSQLGTVTPFNLISNAEQQHIEALSRQAEKYGVSVPANPRLDSTPVFTDLAVACQAGVKAETEDAALYDTLKAVTDHADILRVYTNLQNASLQNHLVEFQACD